MLKHWRNVETWGVVSKPLSRKSSSSVFPCCHEEAICSLSAADVTVTDLSSPRFTLFIKHLWSLVLQETIASLLSNFSTQRVFSLLTFLEKFGYFFETGIWLLFFLFSLFNVVQEESICLVVNILGWSLRLGVDKTLESVDPVDFLFWHSNQYKN